MTKIDRSVLILAVAVPLGALAAACGSNKSHGADQNGTAGTGTVGSSVGPSSSGTGGSSVMGSGTGAGGTSTGTGGSSQGNGGGIGSGTGGTATGAGGAGAGSGGAGVGTGGSGTSSGSGGTGMGSAGSSGGTATPTLPCGVLNGAGNACVAAHSTVRVIVPGYAGPLYQVCKGTANPGPGSCKGMTQDIGSKDGYADAAAQDSFCTGTSCTITKIYDQSGKGNHLEPAPKGGAKNTPDNPANAGALPVTVYGHAAYGILIKAGIGYRTGCSGCTLKTGNGTAVQDQPETQYLVTSQKDLVDGCCFDYGNAETSSNDDGNGTMETIYFGGGVVWGTGFGGKPGPWVMADLENGLYAGWENNQDKNISTNKPLKFDFVNAVVVGDTKDKNAGKGRFALYGGDATSGGLMTMYDGVRPAKTGYVPMVKQGSIVLGIGGDNSNGAGGRFYEGAMASGAATQATLDALQASIVAAGYGK